MTLIEMEGFLRGKCLPGDMLVNETNAQYLHRKLTAYEATVTNLTAQVQGLAAENADLKHPGTYLPSKRETPATDAVMAEIRNESRAEALDSFAKAWREEADRNGEFIGLSIAESAIRHAQQMRAGEGK